MTIHPLQAKSPEQLLPGNDPKRDVGSTSFTRLLDRLQAPGAPHQAKQDRAAAELLRLQMMQSSLSLGGDAEGADASRTQAAISNLISGLARSGSAAKGTTAIDTAAPVAAPATVDPKDSQGYDLSDVGQTASRFLGTPYRFGGESASGIDCSSFVQQVFHEHNIDLPRTAREQMKVGTDVASADLKKGDLLFFRTYASYPSHVGIYLGDGKMIHASSGKGEVTVSDLSSQYYRSRFLGAKRVAEPSSHSI